jgi:hypothetical protein
MPETLTQLQMSYQENQQNSQEQLTSLERSLKSMERKQKLTSTVAWIGVGYIVLDMVVKPLIEKALN